jgi:hypothetical protein
VQPAFRIDLCLHLTTVALQCRREERRLRVFENRRVFGPKRDGMTGEWKKLHNEKLIGIPYPILCVW